MGKYLKAVSSTLAQRGLYNRSIYGTGWDLHQELYRKLLIHLKVGLFYGINREVATSIERKLHEEP